MLQQATLNSFSMTLSLKNTLGITGSYYSNTPKNLTKALGQGIVDIISSILLWIIN
jgi:hypothetical protein